MALNASGPISLGGATAGQSINLENAQPATATVSLNDAAVRGLAGPAFATPATQIQMPTDFYGKSNLFTFTLAAGTDVNLRSSAITAGWPGSGAVQANINSGTLIQSSSTGSYALTINGAWPGGITVINAGTIVGRGGTGGTGANFSFPASTGGAGGTGGVGILVSVPVTINNASGIIAAGGGGGGGGGPRGQRAGARGGSGGGGGSGFGAGGPPGSPAQSAGSSSTAALTGGAGGAGLSGTGGGGAGGNNAGTGTGGQAGALGGPGGAGGAGGNSVSGNPLVTFTSLGTIYGPRV